MFLKNIAQFRLKLNTTPFLISVLVFGLTQANYNVTILLFHDTLYNDSIDYLPAHHMFQRDIFPRKSKVINLTWLKTNIAQAERGKVGVLNALYFMEKHYDMVDGAIFLDVTRDSVVFSSLLEISGIPTVGVFQDQEVLLTQVTKIAGLC